MAKASKTSLDYWRDREEANRLFNVARERSYAKEIERINAKMYLGIQQDIEAFYGRYASSEGITIGAAKQRVSNLDIQRYSLKAKEYVATHNFSPKANAEMKLYNLTMKVNRLEMLKAEAGLTMAGGFSELEDLTGSALTERAMHEFERQSGILGQTVNDPARHAAEIAQASFRNATFSDRVWAHQTYMKYELGKLLESGMIQGKGPIELARDLRKVVDTTQYNAERLLRTELTRAQTQAQKESFEKNGYDEYVFIALETACGECLPLDGEIFKVADMQPGLNASPIHPHCMCSEAAYMDTNDFNKWINRF